MPIHWCRTDGGCLFVRVRKEKLACPFVFAISARQEVRARSFAFTLSARKEVFSFVAWKEVLARSFAFVARKEVLARLFAFVLSARKEVLAFVVQKEVLACSFALEGRSCTLTNPGVARKEVCRSRSENPSSCDVLRFCEVRICDVSHRRSCAFTNPFADL